MSLSDRSSKRQSPYLPSLPLPSPCQRSGRKLFVSLHPGRAPNQPPLHTITRRRNLFLASRWMQRLSQYKPSGLTHRRRASSKSAQCVTSGPWHVLFIQTWTLTLSSLPCWPSHLNVFCSSFKTLGKVCSSTSSLRWD